MRLLLCAVLSIAPPLIPQEGPAAELPADRISMAHLRAFQSWLESYRAGAFRIVRSGDDGAAALAEVDRLMVPLARWNHMIAVRSLFEAATVDPAVPEGTSAAERVDFLREMQPWRVRQLACGHIAAMTAPGLDDWLASHLRRVFADMEPADEAQVSAAIRILGARGGFAGMAALVDAASRLRPKQRVQAVNALSRIATIETVPAFLGMLRDAEPNVRIAALNALGRAMAPATDETLERSPDAEVAELADAVIAGMERLLKRDKIWQVRAAAADNLARLRTARAVPALIAGLKAELRRTKAPAALDLKLHRLLQGMTGQVMIAGQVGQWERFWREHGRSFRFTADRELAAEAGRRRAAGARVYEQFFSIDLESDRLLFVLDFSGSMAEPVTLAARTTVAEAGQPTTKARLVVQELERIVMSLPDDALFNIVVFSDEVRVWRRDRGGRPTLVPLDDDARDDLLGSYLDSLRPQGPTNLYGALELALGFGGRGLYDKYYERGFDTLYLMSDGAPSWGEVIDPDVILEKVRDVNALRRLTIHVVTIGDKNATKFLGKLAEQNGGRHIHVE